MTGKTKVSLSALAYVILYVQDTEKSLLFYRDILGMKVEKQDPGWVELHAGGTRIALHRSEKSGSQGGKNAALVFQVDDVFEVYESLKASGVIFDCEPRNVCHEDDRVGMSTDFKDPDGNLITIFSYGKK